MFASCDPLFTTAPLRGGTETAGLPDRVYQPGEPMSASLLDSLLDSAAAGAQIVSEQHDPGAITFNPADIDRGLAGAAGVWDAAEMGLTAEQARERIAAADTPEARE